MSSRSTRNIRDHNTRDAERRHIAHAGRRRWGLTVSMLAISMMLGGCVIRQLAATDEALTFSYSSLDFSGDVWRRAQAHCQRSGRRVIHQNTDCVVWLRCVSRFTCE